jgi:hypothetical protein
MDSDLNLLSTTIENINVLITVLNNNTTFATTALLLVETSLSSSSFTGILQLCKSCSVSGSISVGIARNRTICATYSDLSHENYNCSTTCDATGHCNYGCPKITASAIACSKISVLATILSQPFASNATTLSILLDDADMDTKDNVDLAYINLASYQNTVQLVSKSVALTETGSATGLFTGLIALTRINSTAACSASSPDLCCGLGLSSNIKISYSDSNPAAQLVTQQLIVCDATIRAPTSFIPGVGLQVLFWIDCILLSCFIFVFLCTHGWIWTGYSIRLRYGCEQRTGSGIS